MLIGTMAKKATGLNSGTDGTFPCGNGENVPSVPILVCECVGACATRAALALAVLSALFLIAARSAQAQTETILYNFTGGSDGASPRSNLTPDAAGNFYGTTAGGGANKGGTVFELSPN